MVGEVAVAAQPRRLRQVAHHPAGDLEAGRGRQGGGREGGQRRLQLVDAGAAVRRVDHHAEPAVGREPAAERAKAGGRVGQVVQHAAAIDVVVGRLAGRRRVEQRAVHEDDVAEAARLGAGHRDGARRAGAIEMHDRAGTAAFGELGGQHDRAVAGATAREQRPQRMRRRARRTEHPVVDLAEMARAADHEAPGLVARVARRIRVGLVLRRDRVVDLIVHRCDLPDGQRGDDHPHALVDGDRMPTLLARDADGPVTTDDDGREIRRGGPVARDRLIEALDPGDTLPAIADLLANARRADGLARLAGAGRGEAAARGTTGAPEARATMTRVANAGPSRADVCAAGPAGALADPVSAGMPRRRDGRIASRPLAPPLAPVIVGHREARTRALAA